LLYTQGHSYYILYNNLYQDNSILQVTKQNKKRKKKVKEKIHKSNIMIRPSFSSKTVFTINFRKAFFFNSSHSFTKDFQK